MAEASMAVECEVDVYIIGAVRKYSMGGTEGT